MYKSIKRSRNNESGFTLIELLIVIVILGVLSAVVVFSVGGINNTSSKSACKADVSTINTAAEAYYAQKSVPALTLTDLTSAGLLHAFATGELDGTGKILTKGTYVVTFTSGAVGPPATAGNAASTTCP